MEISWFFTLVYIGRVGDVGYCISEWGDGDYRCSMGLLEWVNAIIVHVQLSSVMVVWNYGWCGWRVLPIQ